MSRYQPHIVRFSLDLDIEDKNFLREYALTSGISASIVLRALIHMLETDIEFSNRVLDLIFYNPDSEEQEDEGNYENLDS